MSDTHKCSNCGDNDGDERKENFLDGCSRENLGCENPCGRGPHNSAKCESLPSQISNFTTQFFGEVIKTEVNGVVSWSLPCGLDIGLPANPRGVGEGLACYFLRLFNDGITGLKGDKGATGAAGAAGANSFTVTLAAFTQPSPSSPNIQVTTSYNPAMSLDGLYVFIDTSGWYHITGSDGAGTLFLTLDKALAGAPATISAGKLVMSSGTPGLSITGPQGIQGPIGPTGSPGTSFTVNNGVYTATAGTDFLLPNPYGQVTFVTSSPQFTATDTGKYFVTVTATIQGQAGVNNADVTTLKLRNLSLAADVVGGLQEISNIVSGEIKQLTLATIAETTAPNQTIALFGQCGTAGKTSLLWQFTTLSFFRVA